jgi:hypothetical protein
MSTALTTFPHAAAKMWFAWGTRACVDLAQTSLTGDDLTLARRYVR